MNEAILTEIRTHLENSIRDKNTRPSKYEFRSWAALNTWSENIIGKSEVGSDDCGDGNYARLRCFGRAPENNRRTQDLSLNEINPETSRDRLGKDSWNLPPIRELNPDLTSNGSDLSLSTFEERTRDLIIGSANKIIPVRQDNPLIY